MAYGSLLADVVKSSSSSPVTFQNTSGTEVGTLCRAWVNFNGTGTVAIRASFNVSSITDGGIGLYTLNFTNAMPDANYAAAGMAGQSSDTTLLCVSVANQQTTSLRVNTTFVNTSGNYDTPFVFVSVFR